MKTKFFSIGWMALCVWSLILFSSCDDDWHNYIYDFAPVYMQVSLTDDAGHDLLDTTSVYAIDMESVRVCMHGYMSDDTLSIYGDSIGWLYYETAETAPTRAYMPIPKRPFLSHDESGYYICIGEFAGDGLGECTVIWNDSAEDVLSCESKVHYRSNGKVKDITRRFYLNGKFVKKTSDLVFRYKIVK